MTFPKNDEKMFMIVDYNKIRSVKTNTSRSIPIDDSVMKERFTNFITSRVPAKLPTPRNPIFDEIGRKELVRLLFILVLDVVDTMDGTTMSMIPFSEPILGTGIAFATMDISKDRANEMFAHMPNKNKGRQNCFQVLAFSTR